MERLVESLKRLYIKEKITNEKLNELVEKSIITQEEYEYIIGE